METKNSNARAPGIPDSHKPAAPATRKPPVIPDSHKPQAQKPVVVPGAAPAPKKTEPKNN